MSKKDLNKYNAENLHLYGMQNEFKLCHIPLLVVNDVFGAMALEGSSGTGKTTIVKRIGTLNQLAGNGRVGVFSADKARYEDFIGCPIPNPENMQMVTYAMPNSVAQMETILVDEINRATYENQEKWLSLFANREIDSTPVSCKYIFAAMNPILSDDSNDTYEGVQPLDKALGERMMGLIRMKNFRQMDRASRLKVMQSSFNQVQWEPTEEMVELHNIYVTRAREIYENIKATAGEQVAEYIDQVQTDLSKHSQNAVTIEARRAQYMICNILANYALDKTMDEKAALEMSALQALVISFPNPLWEQPINPDALKTAHNKSKHMLKMTTKEQMKRSAGNMEGIQRPLSEILELAQTHPPKEQLSKLINQSIPSESEDPINHYAFALGAVHGLTMDNTNKSIKQTVMKEQEFSRLEKIYEKVVKSPNFDKYEKLAQAVSRTQQLPQNAYIPAYVKTDSDPHALDIYRDCAMIDIGQMSLTIAELPGVEVERAEELMMIMEKITEGVETFKKIKDIYSK